MRKLQMMLYWVLAMAFVVTANAQPTLESGKPLRGGGEKQYAPPPMGEFLSITF